MRKLSAPAVMAGLLPALPACGGTAGTDPEDGVIHMTLWGGESDQAFLAERAEAFQARYPEKTFAILIGTASESTARDVFFQNAEEIKAACGEFHRLPE